MRRKAARAGPGLSVRELPGQLAAIGESVLIYPSTGGRPKARRMTTELSSQQQELYEIFGLQRWAPRSEVIGARPPSTSRHLRKHQQDQLIQESPARR